MTEQQFCYWLQGFAELSPSTPPTPEQWKSIREHLATCFLKVTPAVGIPTPPVPFNPADYFRDQRSPAKDVVITC